MAISKWRGHGIYYLNDVWFYCSDDVKVSDDKDRMCGFCNEKSAGDHDVCIQNLPHVVNACCGHGERGESYAQFKHFTLRGILAKMYFKIIRRKNKNV